ncbi:sugar phosphate isomerase/epimerase family protein [Larsenimonas rhizosphaerae]|uniref:Sugar phosphate isomerase/epimerase n=1 Tax=Larsenimonas rhizosphaerae TaxID=2944682 RepID=A0AA41ZNN7_9GAMM|nr:sugar phosphate isomerase/epimerase family protein [Larsenimonas rhizosphaerae]MCM2131382.1 sugar phosphate isomerase/epimerase [Larsenimonas rhizosphaerae]MCX2525253.1 sugar phosphate isomerase/epimerase [Larsenimonas rhizosphaerae]
MHTIATVSLGGDLMDKLDVIAQAGFEGVEIFESDIHHSRASTFEIGRHIKALGLRVTALQPMKDVEATGHLKRQLERLEIRFAIMSTLGTSLLLTCSNTTPHAIDDPQQACTDLLAMAEFAQQHGCRIGFEALAWGTHINSWQQAWSLVQQVDHPALGLVLDSFHILAHGDPLTPLADVPGDRIFAVQFADAPWFEEESYLHWSRHHRCLPFAGELNMDGFISALHDTGYKGPLSLELFHDPASPENGQVRAADCKRTLNRIDARLDPLPVV